MSCLVEETREDFILAPPGDDLTARPRRGVRTGCHGVCVFCPVPSALSSPACVVGATVVTAAYLGLLSMYYVRDPHHPFIFFAG